MKDYYQLRDKVEEIRLLAERASFVTSELINDYSFAKEPDPAKAAAYISGCDKSIEAEQAFTWVRAYSRVFTLMEIAFDYISGIEKLAAAAVKA